MNQQDDELKHYGVLGMKWGVTRAHFKANSTGRLNKKIKKYETKSAQFEKTSEKLHAKQDLGSSNRAATRAAKYVKKSANMRFKATKADNELTKSIYEKRAAKYDLKSAKNKLKADKLSKTTGYGVKAMKYSIKSDKAKINAEKAKLKLASDKAYINKMNSKLNSMSKADREKVQSYIDKYLK